MATTNCKRIVMGGLLGGLVWNVWSVIINVGWLGQYYQNEIRGGGLNKEPRYAFFMGIWIATLLVLGVGVAWLYAVSRSTLGPGPLSALKVGLVVGVIAGFPLNLAQACWAPISQWLPLGWMLDILVGCVLAALVGGWYYREE